MAIEDALFSLITQASSLQAIFGTGMWLFPTRFPDNAPFPNAVYNKVAEVTEETILGSSGFVASNFQLDVFTRDYSQGQSAVTALRTLLYGYRTQTPGNGVVIQGITEFKTTYSYDPETQLMRWLNDFRVWYGLQSLP